MELAKLIAAFKAKYPNVKLSDPKLKAFSTKLAPKITDETTVDARLEELDEIMPFEDMAKEEARIAKLEAKSKEKKVDPKKKAKTEEEDNDDDSDDDVDEPALKKDRTPAYVKKMMEKLESLTTEITTIKAEKAQGTIKQKVAEKLKDIPATYWENWNMPENDEDLDAFVTKVTTGYEGFTQDMTDKGFSNMSRPKGASGSADSKKATDAELKSVLAKI